MNGSSGRGGWFLRRIGGRVPLSVNLFSILLGVTATVAVTLAIYAHWSGTRTAEETADRLLSAVIEKVAGRVTSVLQPASLLADVGGEVIMTRPGAEPIGPEGHPLATFAERALGHADSLYSVYAGWDDGTFLQIINLGRHGSLARAAHNAPDQADYVRREIGLSPEGIRWQQWSFLDSQGAVVERRRDSEPPAYDPRKRPWYDQALQTGRLTATDLYVFNSLGQPGITLARPLVGGDGVLGVDMTLGALSDFLANQQISPGARIAIFGADGSVMATPGLAEILDSQRSTDGSLRVVTVEGLGDPALIGLFHSFQTWGTVASTYDVDEDVWLARTQLVETGRGQQFLVGVAAPRTDFTGPVDRMRRNSLTAAGLLLLVGVPISLILSRRMSRALAALAQEAESIERLDLDGDIKVHTFVREIHTLTTAMAVMKRSLRTFGLYVPMPLVKRVMAAGGLATLGGQRREISLVFTDITNYTGITESLDPEALMSRTSDYFDQVAGAVAQHKGVIDKYIGDAVMSMWNAPLDDPDHTLDACRAALEVRARVARFNAKLEAAAERPMVTRIGVHVGEAVVGNVGTSDRINYSAVGATVNDAARIERMNKIYGTNLLISQAVADRLGGQVLVRAANPAEGPFSSDSLAVFELVALAPGTPEQRTRCDQWAEAMALLSGTGVEDRSRAAEIFSDLADVDPSDGLATYWRGRLAVFQSASAEPAPGPVD